MSFWDDLLARIFSRRSDAPRPGFAPLQVQDVAPLEPITQRVLLITFNPVMDPARGTRMIEFMGWNQVEPLVNEICSDIEQCSRGLVKYDIRERIEVDEFPPLEDGWRYDPQTFLKVMDRKMPPHKPDMLDYVSVIDQFDMINRVMRNEIDEVWMYAFPYAGFYESRMVGRESYWCNAPALDIAAARKRFVVMGFNYERGVGEAEEALGHRIESIINKVYEPLPVSKNLYRKFITYDKQSPGNAQVGWMHYAPNSQSDYDWGNTSVVTSTCDDWLNFPNLTGEARNVSCRDWGNGDIRAHHKWWFDRLPHAPGRVDGIRCNWWHYAMRLDPEG